MQYVIRTVECRNGIFEKTKFPVNIEPTERRTREQRREIDRAAKNTGSAKRNFARLLNHNFAVGDKHITLDLSDKGMDRVRARADKLRAKLQVDGAAMDDKDLMHRAMETEAENLNRRVLRACRSAGVDYMYACAVSDMTDAEDIDHTARLHIHMVVNRAAAEIVAKKWEMMGAATAETLSAWTSGGVEDWTRLATYIIGQSRAVGTGKRYTISRNLQKPPHKDRVAVRPDALLRAPSGCVLLEQSAYIPGRPQYIRYIRPRYAPPPDDGEDAG